MFGGYGNRTTSPTTISSPFIIRIYTRGSYTTGGTIPETEYYDNFGRVDYPDIEATPIVIHSPEFERLARYSEEMRRFIEKLKWRREHYWGEPVRSRMEHAKVEELPPSHHAVTMRTRGRTRGHRRGRIVRSYFRQKHRTRKAT